MVNGLLITKEYMTNLEQRKKELELEIDNYYDRATAARTKLEMLSKLPDEPPMDSVIYFQKRFGNRNGKIYTYVAVRVPHIECDQEWDISRWFITGLHQKPYTWPALLEYIMSQELSMPKIWLATEWTDSL